VNYMLGLFIRSLLQGELYVRIVHTFFTTGWTIC